MKCNYSLYVVTWPFFQWRMCISLDLSLPVSERILQALLLSICKDYTDRD